MLCQWMFADRRDLPVQAHDDNRTAAVRLFDQHHVVAEGFGGIQFGIECVPVGFVGTAHRGATDLVGVVGGVGRDDRGADLGDGIACAAADAQCAEGRADFHRPGRGIG